MRSLLLLVAISACKTPAPAVTTGPASPRSPITLTYLGVAGWQIDSAGRTILVDPYFSRPNLDGAITSDPAAVAKHAPKRADAIVIGHSHVDHLLDAPAVAIATGAVLIGSDSTAKIARSLDVPAPQIIPIKGGEDYAFTDFSIRVIPGLHSALDHKTVMGKPVTILPPSKFSDWEEGGAFNYLVRVGGHEVFVQSSANFIEREVAGLRPDIAIIAPGLREEIYDYTCRLMHALGDPPLVFVNHFDDWRSAPVDAPPSEDLKKFIAEVATCSPRTRVVVPKHFAPNAL